MRIRTITVHMDLHASLSMDSNPGPLSQRLGARFPRRHQGQHLDQLHPPYPRHRKNCIESRWLRHTGCKPGKGLRLVFTIHMGRGRSGLVLSIAFNIATGMLGGTLELVSAQ